MTKTISIYSMKGDVTGSIDLPDVFNTPYRPDLIQRAVVSIQSMIRQSYGTSPVAGLNTSAGYYGRRGRRYRQTINKEMSRLPREKPGGGGLGKVRRVPQSVGGRRAHPPKSEKITIKSLIIDQNASIHMLGYNSILSWKQKGEHLEITFTKKLEVGPAYALRIKPKPLE